MISQNLAKATVLIVITVWSSPCLGQSSFGDSAGTVDHPGVVAATREVTEKYLGDCDTSLFLAGDSIITQPWSHITDPSFQKLVGEIRSVDAAIVNLEMLIHEYKGYAQAESGGSHLAAPPKIAAELAWAGIDMVAHANNHTFDYGSIGVLENLEHVTAAGLVLAGSGKDLQHARAPRYFNSANKTVGLVSAASTFVSFGKASRSRPDMHGRPGLNPLTTTDNTFFHVTRGTADFLGSLSKFFGYQGGRFAYDSFNLSGIKFKVGDRFGLEYGKRIVKHDLEGNLQSIGEAVERADIVIMSLHAHHKMDTWLTRFSHRLIDAGADIVFIHGPHRILGIEVYKEKLIFYGLGDFLFQGELVERFPAEFYERYGLGDDATPQEAIRIRSAGGTRSFPADREVWESFAASLCFVNDQISYVRLLPLDLGFGKPLPIRGRPRYADRKVGHDIIDQVKRRSAEFNTRISYDEKENMGILNVHREH